MADHNEQSGNEQSGHGYPGPLATRGPIFIPACANYPEQAPTQADAVIFLRIPVPHARVILCALRTAQRAAGGLGNGRATGERARQIRAVADDLEGMILRTEAEAAELATATMKTILAPTSPTTDSMDSER